MTATMTAILSLLFTSSSLSTASAYSCGWVHGTSTSIHCRQSTSTRCRRDSRISKNARPLFSSNSNEDSSDVPDISATQADIDFLSVHDVDWAEMDPLHEISFDDYEELYIQGKAKGDDSLLSESNPSCDARYESIMTEWDDSVPTLNHISMVGRVGNPPEARYFDNPLGGENSNYNSNKPNVVVSMSLALPRYYSAWEREQEGIQYGQEETEWYNLEVWGYLAEWALKNVQKGTRLGVVGSIDTDYYRNKNTDMLSTNQKVLVQDLDILESKMEADFRRNNNNYNSNNSYGNNNTGGNYNSNANYNNNNYGNNNNGGNYNSNANYNNNNYGNNNNGGNYNSNANYNNNNNNYGNGQQQRDQDRGPSFFTEDDDDDNNGAYDPSGGGSAGGFFDST